MALGKAFCSIFNHFWKFFEFSQKFLWQLLNKSKIPIGGILSEQAATNFFEKKTMVFGKIRLLNIVNY